MLRARCLSILTLLACAAPAGAVDTGPAPTPGETRSVLLAGNNWDGTTDVIDPYTLERLDRINVIPDKAERDAEIALDPAKTAFFLAIAQQVGEGHNQYNDDVFSSHDGRTIFVSRPSYADVVAIDLATKKIVWRTPVGGYRADHMAISPDGTKLLVSASTANVVDQIDTATGKITGSWASGDSPHESNYIDGGKTILHASIGRVYLPNDSPAEDSSGVKGKRVFQIVDADTLKVVKEIDMGKKLEEAGFPDMSSAVRPMAIAPDERHLYFQVSFFHGFVEYDLKADKVLRIAKLPVSEETAKLPRSDYLLDSAHHGLAINPTGDKLCVAGTMSNYGAIVDRKTFAYQRIDGISKPYWSTNSYTGRQCYISGSGDDAVWVISYAAGKKLAKIPVGDHPQRLRNGVARLDIYPRANGAANEKFDFRLKAPKVAFTVGAAREAISCRAAGVTDLRLSDCLIRIVKGKTTLAAGERIERDRKGFAVDVELTPAGTKRLRGHRTRATLVALGTDSVGRTSTVRRKVTLIG